MEMADLIAITKADGPNKIVADNTRIAFQNALHLFPRKPSGWLPQVHTCSARNNTGIEELWRIIMEYIEFTRKSGFFDTFRKEQAVIRMHDTIVDSLNHAFYSDDEVKAMLPELERQLHDGTVTSYKAAVKLLDKYFKGQTK
jgi:LAO/AO transport system kinase